MDFGILSIVPPLISIILALITKEVISSLIIGILAGGVIFTHGDIYNALMTVFNLMGEKLGSNSLMVIFLASLGALVTLMNRAGGSFAYGKWAGGKIKRKSTAKLSAALLGMLIFIDDYFNCLTVGAVMKPITDKNKVSRTKLAYIIDSTAAPMCIIAPVSSWAASVVSNIGEANVANPMGVFISTIPFNLYALLTLFSVVFFSLASFDIGPMARYEILDTSYNKEEEAKEDNLVHSDKGTVMDLILPVLTLIVVTIFTMLYTGGYFGENNNLKDAFGDASVNISLVMGAIVAIFLAFVMYIPRKVMTFREFMESINDGVKSMTGAIIILTLAWTIGGITKAEYLNTGGFVAGKLMDSNVPIWVLPSVIFVVAAFLAFSTGTAWGTFGILIPIIVPIVVHLNVMENLPIILASIFSGSVFGDHCSPISDTTILSSAGAGCNHIDHVRTQLPYALTVAAASFIGFLFGGYTNNVFVALLTSFAGFFAIVLTYKKLTYKKIAKDEVLKKNYKLNVN